MRALDVIADLRILLVPEITSLPEGQVASAVSDLREYVDERNLFSILDPPSELGTVSGVNSWVDGAVPDDAAGLALYFPHLSLDIGGESVTAGPSGTMAAVYELNDQASGIWRAPAGPNLPLAVSGLSIALSNAEIDQLSSKHINAIRDFPGIGIVPWGSRTRDTLSAAGESKFISASRTLRWMEASIARGLASAAEENNDAILWATLRAEVQNFLHGLFRDGAFAGDTPSQAYFVICDQTTTTPADIAAARVFLFYGVSLIRPAEFAVTSVELASFDPLRPIPELPVEMQLFGNDLYLSYPTVPGFRYRRQTSSTEPSFAGGSLWIDGNGEWQRERITINALHQFYRIEGERVSAP
jgi:hypothetical protein